MLAELTLLLHEMLEPADSRGRSRSDLSPRVDVGDARVVIVVTGLASPGKARLIDALQSRLRGTGVTVEPQGRFHDGNSPALRVHAETDLEALVEGAPVVARAARDADLIVPVDWEAPARSVTRVMELLIARGVVAPEV